MNTEKMENKILLAIQFYEGDREQAMRLMRFIADLEPKHCELADVIFVARFDCKHDDETVQYVSRKFNTHAYRSPRRGTGWPNGCNDLWWGTQEWFFWKMQAKQIPHYKAIFTFEADGVPLSRGWINHFSYEWDKLQETKKTYVAGALVRYPDYHVNGNMFLSGDLRFLQWLVKRVGATPPGQGWDYYLRKPFEKWGWAQLPGLVSEWNMATCPPEHYKELLDSSVYWHHGCKDSSLYEYSHKKLLA